MMIHKLTDEEIDLARQIARERNQNKKEHNVESGRIDDSQTNQDIHFAGALGEVAVGHELGLKINRNISASGDNGWDLRNGDVTVEVKMRQGTEKDFAMDDNVTDLEADLGILCWGKGGRDIILAGWITRAEWKMMAKTLHFGSAKRRGIEYTDMRPVTELYKVI